MTFINDRKRVIVDSYRMANVLLNNGFSIQKIKRHSKRGYAFVFRTDGRINDLIDIAAANI